MPSAGDRLSRAVPLIDGVNTWDGEKFTIVGSKGTVYSIVVDRTKQGGSRCTCPDHTEKGNRCKHLWACALWEVGRKVDYLDF